MKKGNSGKLIENNDAVMTKYGKKKTKNGVMKFLYNREKGTCCGRTCKSWVQFILFYIIFYICLAAFWIICFAIFWRSIDETVPKFYDHGSIIGATPGLNLIPRDNNKTQVATITFNVSDSSSYKNHVFYLKNFLSQYTNTTELIDCTSNKQETDSCQVNTADYLKFFNSDSYGYEEGKPTIILFLNRLLKFTPKNLTNIPKELETIYRDNKIPFFCNGIKNANNLKIKMYPENGIDFKYFPYHLGRNYHRPFVMVQFSNIEINDSSDGTRVVCSVYFHNTKTSETIKEEAYVDFKVLK